MIDLSNLEKHVIRMPSSNYFQGFDKKKLLKFAASCNGYIQFLHPVSSYLLKQSPLLCLYTNKEVSKKDVDAVLQMVDLFYDESIETNFYYGFHQLAEIAIKALSPGINDPQTAVISMHALTDLFLYLICNNMHTAYKDKDGENRIFINQRSNEDLFAECFQPIWNYGKEDMYVQDAMLNMITQLKEASDNRYSPSLEKLLQQVQQKNEERTN